MSHDQKPARVRVVTNAGTPPQRRRGDGTAPVVIDMPGGTTTKGAVGPVAVAKRGRLLPAILFLAGSAAGGVGVAMLGRT